MKRFFYLTQLATLFLFGFISCSKESNEVQSGGLFSLDAAKIPGEWIYKSATSNNYRKTSILKTGEFDETEVTRGWSLASINEKGTWSVDSNTIIGAYKKKTGEEATNEENVSVRIETISQSNYSFVAKNGAREVTYKKLLDEIKLCKGQTVIPECLPEKEHTETKKIVTPFETRYETITTEVVKDFVSDNTTVATVDKNTGAISAIENGIAFVDVVTADNGTATIKVIVDDDYTGLFGKTREEIHNIYGTSNISVDNISQTMYNMDGDFSSIKMVYKNGVVDYVLCFLRKDADIFKYKNYISENHYLWNERDNYWAYDSKPTHDESDYQIQVENKNYRHIGYFANNHKSYKDPFDDYSIAMDKNRDDLIKLYGKPYINTFEGMGYIIPNGFNTYVNRITLQMEDNICRMVIVELQQSVNTQEVLGYLGLEFTLLGYIIDAPQIYVFNMKDSEIQVQYDTSTNIVYYWYPQTVSTRAAANSNVRTIINK